MHFVIDSQEGLPIRGDFNVPDHPRALVVLVHGFKGFKDWGFFPWLAELLCSRKFAVCRFNMSRSGIGEDSESFDRLDLFADDTYSIQVSDLRSVVAHARTLFPRLPLFLLGHSRGGGVALLTARSLPGLAGVITWSAIASAASWDEQTKKQWRRDGFTEVVNARTKQVMRMSTAILDDYEAHAADLDILGSTERLEAPLLIVHGARDESVPVIAAQRIYDAAPEASLLVIGTASHTYNAIHPLIHVPKELAIAAEVTSHFVSAYA